MLGSLRAFVVGVSLCSVGLAVAQPKLTDAQKQQASDLVKKAIARSQADDHEVAIELYLQAYAIIPQPMLLSNVGAEYAQDDKPVEALKYFCMYLDKDPTGTNVTYATAQAKLLQAKLGNPDGEICKPAKPPEPIAPAITPPPEPPAPKITADLSTATPPAPSAGRTLRIAGLATGAAGLAGLGASVFFGLRAKHDSDLISEHNQAMSWPDNIKQIEAEGQSAENKQIVFLVVGGAATVTGAVLYIVGRSKKGSSERIALTPTASAHSVGVSLGGAF
ncbi:MAG: hypothetical protein H6Q90_2867 [Deltaproteobacteria bacterium]|nr:hypothetical protein [Deltaproteobacteria bacterium]